MRLRSYKSAASDAIFKEWQEHDSTLVVMPTGGGKTVLFAEVNFSSALSQLDQAWTDVKTAKPFAVCPTCQGQLPDQCTLCRGRGLISEYRWTTCVTREDKEFREKVKSGKRKPEARKERA